MDVLPVQASAVPCERIFSSSKETITPRRSRISGVTVEMLQVLKYCFKRDRLDFTTGELADEADYSLDGPVTAHAVQELIASGKFDELNELFTNSTTT
jgi:hypothetical protein